MRQDEQEAKRANAGAIVQYFWIPLDRSPYASREPAAAAVKVGDQTPPAVEDRPPVGPADVVRAVRDFQRGSDREKNFELLFRCFCPRIERFLRSRIFSPEERLDLTQEVLLRVYQGLDGYRGEGSLEGWVLQIAFNAYRSWRDRQPGGRRAAPEVSFADASGTSEPSPAAPFPSPSAAGSPLDDAVRRERLEALREAIGELSPKQRLCTELRVYQERSVQEIAVALRISPETVKAHLFQARQRLWEKLHPTFGSIGF
jgi:RNA polymerase sigma-70 factor (ECF subfamily)